MGTGTVKFLLVVSWALVSESNAVFINWTDFKKQNTKKQKGVENFMLKKKRPPMKLSVALCICEVSQLPVMVVSFLSKVTV